MTDSLVRDLHCKDARLLGAYLDGELEASSLLDIEKHLSACDTCHERVELDRATRQSLKREVRKVLEGRRVSLRARAMTAMLAEKTRSEVRASEAEARSRRSRWRTVVPIATAAALALFWGAASRGPLADSSFGVRADPMRAGIGDDLLADLLHEHSNPVPPQWTDLRDVRALDQYVGVPVHPSSFEKGGAAFVGARVLPIHQQRAAMLQYVIGNGAAQRRLSLFIYDPSKIQISGPGLAPREVGTAEVSVGQANGYSVAVTQHSGVGYTVASDLGPERNAQLAALATETE